MYLLPHWILCTVPSFVIQRHWTQHIVKCIHAPTLNLVCARFVEMLMNWHFYHLQWCPNVTWYKSTTCSGFPILNWILLVCICWEMQVCICCLDLLANATVSWHQSTNKTADDHVQLFSPRWKVKTGNLNSLSFWLSRSKPPGSKNVYVYIYIYLWCPCSAINREIDWLSHPSHPFPPHPRPIPFKRKKGD